MFMLWVLVFFFFKQKVAYENSECDWSSDVCSSDLIGRAHVCTPVTFRNLVCRLLLEKKTAAHRKSPQRPVPSPGSYCKCDRPRPERWLSLPDRPLSCVFFFFFNDTATTEIYTNLNTLSLHDALPIYSSHIQKSRMPSSACDWS